MLGQLFAIAYTEARKVWYFRWTAIGVASLIFLLSATLIYFLPNSYNAWGQVYIDDDTALAAATADLSFAENKIGNTFLIEKTLLSDQSLERVLKKLNPSYDAADKQKREAAIKSLRGSVTITRGGDDAFIEFHVKGEDPVKARLIAKTIMDQFIDDNMNLSRSDLTRAGAFLNTQIAAYSQLLAESQSNLATFSRRHPRIAAATTPVGARGGEFVGGAAPVQGSGQAPVAASAPLTADTSAVDNAIGDLENRVAGLLTQYTEQYPDVVAARRQIASLRAQRTALISAAAAKAAAAPVQAVATPVPSAPAPRRYVAARPRTQTVVTAPVVAPDLAAQWEGLRRENELLAGNYQKLVQRREAATMSLAFYSSDGPGKFQIIREPTVPSSPSGPNRPLFLGLAAVVALGAGLALAYLRAAIAGIFVSPRELEDAFHLPVVGTVSWEPAWHTGSDRNKTLALPFLGRDGPRLLG